MRRYAGALHLILDAVDLNDRIGSLQLFGAAEAIARTLDEHLDARGFESSKAAREKLGLFRSYFLNAVAPGPETDHIPGPQWLVGAGRNLALVEASLG